MSETIQTQIRCPPELEHLLEDLRELTLDGENPNRMTQRQHEAVWKSLTGFGWVQPIITNVDGLVADGEQRITVCLDHGETHGPVLRLPVEDIDRRLLRQVLNKLRGRHDYTLDSREFLKMVEAGRGQDIRDLIGLSEKRLQRHLERLREDEKPGEAGGEAGETLEELARCPRCGFMFNPGNFMVGEIQLEPEEEQLDQAIRMGQDRGLGKQNTVVLDLSFTTTPPGITDRSVAVAEAFGVGVDETIDFEVYHRLELSYDDDDLIYVTGDSGSGKTTLLRLLGDYEAKRGRRVVDFADIQPDPDEVVIDGLGEDVDEAMRLLSAAGLSEAFLMLRRYSELSDGQRYRYRLAKMMSAHADVYLIDELGATLDRVMARVLAYSLQSPVRLVTSTMLLILYPPG